MKSSEKFIVKIENLAEEPYDEVLRYPKPDEVEVKKRIAELKELGVESLEFTGEKRVSNVPVLGKGCVGIVVVAHLKSGERVALKIRRVDADRVNMKHEAEMLAKANDVGVGPKLLTSTDNFLLMQYIEGELFPEWLNKTEDADLIRQVLRELLEQCFRLDNIGLDHGELSNASKHLIITENGKPYIIDFETASANRRTANLTSLAQYLLIKKPISNKIHEKIGKIDTKQLIEALREYKKEKSEENFEKVLKVCKLA